MRGIVWVILLFTAAVVAATALGHNDGLVTVAWRGWRTELSLNLALVLLLAGVMALLAVLRALEAFVSLPRRASEWRALQRERGAHAALREALTHYFGARYSRAHRAARRAIAIHDDAPDLGLPTDHRVLAQLLAAGSLHRLQDRPGRDALLSDAQAQGGSVLARGALEGGQLLAAEWALDDQDPDRAQTLLAGLPAGVARRTQALRLRLRAARLARRTQEALDITRLLAKHQAFSEAAASGLLRALALEHLDAARDAAQLRRQWLQLDDADRGDPIVLAHAARRAVAMGAPAEARQWLEAAWSDLPRLPAEDRSRLLLALSVATTGAGVDWLERTETASRTWPADPAVALAAGLVCAERQLWGKARQLLEPAAGHASLPAAARRRAWRTLAHLARQDGDDERAARCDRAAAEAED